jgi:hypothetical protein
MIYNDFKEVIQMESKLLDCQKKAQKNWVDKNRDRSNYIKAKGSCKSFIRNKATKEDLQELQRLINEKLQEL